VQLNASTTIGATYKWTGPGGYISGTQNPLMFGSKLIIAIV
jgi:hypothetical protein